MPKCCNNFCSQPINKSKDFRSMYYYQIFFFVNGCLLLLTIMSFYSQSSTAPINCHILFFLLAFLLHCMTHNMSCIQGFPCISLPNAQKLEIRRYATRRHLECVWNKFGVDIDKLIFFRQGFYIDVSIFSSFFWNLYYEGKNSSWRLAWVRLNCVSL